MADLDSLVIAARAASIRRDVADGFVRELERWAPRRSTRPVWPLFAGATLAIAAAATAVLLVAQPGSPPDAPVAVVPHHPADAPIMEPPPPPAAPMPAAAPIVQPPRAIAPAKPAPAIAPVVPPQPSIKDHWRDARLLRAQGHFAEAVTANLAIADAADATWSPIALVEAVRIEVGPLADPERAIELADRVIRDWPRDALIGEARGLRCQALGQLGRGCKPR